MIRCDLPLFVVLPWLFAIGAVIGSFLNVCIYRLPSHDRLRDQIGGLWRPPSHCPRCGKRILLRDNVPVLGWMLLGGRCRFCRRSISPRYPLIEAANGLLFVVVFLAEVPCGFNKSITESCVYSPLGPQGDVVSWLFSPTAVVLWRWLYHMVLLESLVVATFIDFDLRIIPDGATLPAMAVGVLGGCFLGCVYLVPVWFQDPSVRNMLAALWGQPLAPVREASAVPGWVTAHPHLHGLAVSLAGIVVGGGSVWVVRLLGQWVLKREAMGFGDVILMAMIGSFLGWQPVLIVFFLAPLCALFVVAALWVFRREREIPYGPYLSLATLILILLWQQIWPGAERIFSLGPVLLVMAVFMCALLFLTLLAMQGVKRLLRIPDYIPPEEQEIWQPADQLFHFANNDGDRAQTAWRAPQWPGIVAARGSLYEHRWRNAGPGRK